MAKKSGSVDLEPSFNHVEASPTEDLAKTNVLIERFIDAFDPVEATTTMHIFADGRTGARYCECHVRAKTLCKYATTDVALDPDGQAEYRANREVVANHVAFERMKADATAERSFSNIVAEFSPDTNESKPLGIIGGQHRFQAIQQAYEKGIDKYHEVKVYFALSATQRLDVQVISNTVIAVSRDLYDRMIETVRGPQLRQWSQETGLLDPKHDFGDKRQRGGRITVQMARSFIMNYFAGVEDSGHKNFDSLDSTPIIASQGDDDPKWEATRNREPSIWDDDKLKVAAQQFSTLVKAQRKAFQGKKGSADSQEKALNMAILTAWAYTAGLLSNNKVRLARHFVLSEKSGKDPPQSK
jgi:hypothetical protein